ncbi:MAG: AAA family ATPase [Pseudomonadota bacterium]
MVKKMKLCVQGYKSISDSKSLSFDGLTVLAGANSSGKSSFMQPFLILKQTIENHYDSESLILYGENAKLTDSSQIISKVPGYDKKMFSIAMESNKGNCVVVYKYKRGHGLQVESVSLVSQSIPNGLTLKVGMPSNSIEDNVPEDDFKFIREFYEEKNLRPKWKALRDKCFIKAELSFDKKEFAPLKACIAPTTPIENFISRMIHVPGLRGNPERTYKIADSGDVYPGSFEKYVACIVKNWSTLKKHQAKYSQLNTQLNELGLAANISTQKVDDTSVEIQISRTKSETKGDCVNIADVGFGVSQTIPVLVALLVAKKGQFVYIEQPELHLHPKAQFKLANIIVAAIKRGVKVIIETHSSVLIRGIQIAVATKQLDKEKVSLNWFTQSCQTGATEVATAELDEFGAFGEWPEDFDDTSLQVEQMYLDAVEEAVCAY